MLLAESGMIEGRVLQLRNGQPDNERESSPCNVVIFDPCQIEEDIADFVSRIRRIRDDTTFVVYSSHFSGEELEAALCIERFCCVSKSDDPEHLVLATLSAHRGAIYFSHSVTAAWGGSKSPAAARTASIGDDRLSPRENAVLLAFARGMGLKQISQQMGLSERTVNTYKSRAARKLNLASRSEIVQYALANRLI